ncbi:sigma factor [Actinomadura litoris]|uniref:RNA polymerase sigma factor n=1 Tax=Actinomadura litoris TaxID=2678616 RepID=A0A7K1LA89_9ACTN|nr:sigma factor [Actinomadura litoris]MUN41105.1 RNA polymerase sigma factor [Actinomadura litoris]
MPRVSPSEPVADRRLVKGLNEGDEAALAALYDEYGERLYDYALSMTGDEKAASGIVHDTFIDACRRAPRMRDHLHLSSWLYGASRRRCLREGRAEEPYWDPDAEFPDAPFMDRAGTGEPDDEWPPSEELHELLRAGMARLEPVDQEVVVLAFRHGLRPTRLGAALGLSTRRAALRIRRGGDALEAAVADELHNAVAACAAGGTDAAPALREPVPHRRGPRSGALWRTAHRRGEIPESSGDPVLDAHIAQCPDCRRRAQVRAAALLGRAPAPVLPAALRHRVMHTATDPELAGYRADIAARGGTLTPEGLPSQPDVPSPFTRKWLITGGGMAGALVAALVAVFVMGPGLGGDPLSWPPLRTRPQPSITHQVPSSGPSPGRDPREPKRQGQGQPAPVVPGPGAGSPTLRQGTEGQESTAPGGPSPTPPPSSDPPQQGPGDLLVSPAKVELYGTKTATVRLAAKSGPVTWTAGSSSERITLSQTEGGMPKDGTSELTLTLHTTLIGLPGRGTLTFTDAEGTEQTVSVVWGASIL